MPKLTPEQLDAETRARAILDPPDEFRGMLQPELKALESRQHIGKGPPSVALRGRLGDTYFDTDTGEIYTLQRGSSGFKSWNVTHARNPTIPRSLGPTEGYRVRTEVDLMTLAMLEDVPVRFACPGCYHQHTALITSRAAGLGSTGDWKQWRNAVRCEQRCGMTFHVDMKAWEDVAKNVRMFDLTTYAAGNSIPIAPHDIEYRDDDSFSITPPSSSSIPFTFRR